MYNEQLSFDLVTETIDQKKSFKDIIKKYDDVSHYSNGFLPIGLPTGFGKSYDVFDYLSDLILSIENGSASCDRKYFFISSQSKLLPKDDLYDRLKDKTNDSLKARELVDKYTLTAKSNYRQIIDFLSEEKNRYCLPEEIIKSESYKELVLYLDFYHRSNSYDNFILLKITQAEREFRKVVKNYLKNTYSDKYPFIKKMDYNQKMVKISDIIQNDKDLQFIGKMYPASLIYEKPIVVMTMSKFLYPFDSIIGNILDLSQSELVKNAFIFIDEIDTCKSVINDYIINTSINEHNIERVRLFIIISRALEQLNLNEYQEMDEKLNNSSKSSICQTFKDLKVAFLDIYKEYRLNRSIKMEDGIENGSSINLLFRGRNYINTFSNDGKYLVLDQGKDDIHNYITIVDKDTKFKINRKIIPLTSMLNRINGSLNYFKSEICFIASRLMELDDTTTLENEIYTIINQLGLTPELLEPDHGDSYITNFVQSIISYYHSHKSIKNENPSVSVYDNGFDTFVLKNSEFYKNQTGIMTYGIDCTAERILLEICNLAFVMGISATVDINSILNNFDMDYLSRNLDDQFYRLDEEDFSILSKEYNEKVLNGYENNQISVNCNTVSNFKILNSKNVLNSFQLSFKTILKNDSDEFFKEICCIISRYDLNNDFEKKEYIYQRYWRLFTVYYQFLSHDIQSMICFFSILGKEDKMEFNSKFILEILKVIYYSNFYSKEKYDKDQQMNDLYFEKTIYMIDTNNFESKRNEYSKFLSDTIHNRAFIITSYATLGAGVNPTYKIPKDNDEIYTINSLRSSDQKDIDAVYLDDRTNTITTRIDYSMNPMEQFKSLLHIILDLKYLFEAGDLTYSEDRYATLQIIKKMNPIYSKEWDGLNRDQIQSIRDLITSNAIQTIGRICRTYNKSKEILIFASEQIYKNVDPSYLKKEILLTKECQEFLKSIEEYQNKTEANKAILIRNSNIYRLKNGDCYDLIKEILNSKYNKDSANIYILLGKIVCRYPTISENELMLLTSQERYLIKSFYLKDVYGRRVNKYYFYQQNSNNEYSNIVICDSSEIHAQEISMESSRLDQLLLIDNDDFARYLQLHNVNTDWQEGDYIMPPVLYNNFYKGRIGELAVKYFFEKKLGFSLKVLGYENEEVNPDLFEKFDFIFNYNGRNFLIDAKHWNDNFRLEESEGKAHSEIIAKYYSKIKSVNAVSDAPILFIINDLLDDVKYNTHVSSSDGFMIVEIPSLWIYKNNKIYNNEESVSSIIKRLTKENGNNG